MIITFGQHNGKSVEMVMIKHPEYMKWVLNQPMQVGGIYPKTKRLT